MSLLRPIVLSLLSCSLAAQSVTYYGPGTGMTVAGTPRLGMAVDITTWPLGGSSSSYSHSDTSGLLVLGMDQISVPFRAGYTAGGTQPAPWVTLLTTPIVAIPMPIVTNTGTSWTYQSSHRLAVPNTPALVGYSVMAQWLYRNFLNVPNNFPSNYDRVSTSNAAMITVGF